MTSPLASTLAEVCSAHPSWSISFVSVSCLAPGAAGVFCCADRKELNRNCVRMKKIKDSRLPGFMGLLMQVRGDSWKSVEERDNTSINSFQ